MALVAARDMAGSVGPTVEALAALPDVDEVVVVDDGSADGTGDAALAAGARVLRLAVNLGKGAAVRAGVDATPEADVYLLVDADVGATAAASEALLAPVLEDQADLAVAVLPAAGRRGGVGLVRRLAAAGIRRATGEGVRAPLSGQRAVRARLLRTLALAERFGLETAMTVDARRAGARVVEVEVAMDHRHRGRSLAGFAHRARQGADIARALWPRLTTSGQRVAAIVTAFAVMAAGAMWAGSRSQPSSVALADRADRADRAHRPAKVLLFGLPGSSVDDLGSGAMPNLDGLARRGAVAATTVRALSDHPSAADGYATLGAGSRVRAGDDALSSTPGALGDALRGAGLRTGVVFVHAGGGPPPEGDRGRWGPGAMALMGSDGSVDVGPLGADLADPGALGRELAVVLDQADVVLVDAAGADQAAPPAPSPPDGRPSAGRERALAVADRALGQVAGLAGPDVLLLVVSVFPPGPDWRLTPMVASGRGVTEGHLYSPSTRRPGLVTLTDVAPTVLQALGVEVPDEMIGQALRYSPGQGDLGLLRSLDRDAALREDLYYPVIFTFIGLQVLVYLAALLALRVGAIGRTGAVGPAGPMLRLAVLTISAWPLASYLVRLLPGLDSLGPRGILVILALDAGVVAAALRARRHPLSPLAWICASTIAVLVVDLANGAHLQLSSFLGYSPYTAARFSGLGNAAFAALAFCAMVVAAVHVDRAPRRREALVTVAALLALVVVVDGAPWLGSDVGGILTLVPAFGLTLLALAGRRLSWRTALTAAGAAALALGVAAGVDMMRPPDARTHLGQLVDRVADGGLAPLTTVMARKAAGSLRTFESPLSWTLPIVIAYGLSLLLRPGRRPRWLADRPALHAGAVGMIATALLGSVVNDSGVVVLAMVFVYIGPFLTLLAVHRPAEPVLLEPAPARPTDPAAGADPLLLRR